MKMQKANTYPLPALVVVEFPHGFEAVPTMTNGKPTRYASIDADGVIVAWSSLTPPALDNGAWCLDSDDLAAVGMVGEDDGTTYTHAAASLRRIDLAGDGMRACIPLAALRAELRRRVEMIRRQRPFGGRSIGTFHGPAHTTAQPGWSVL